MSATRSWAEVADEWSAVMDRICEQMTVDELEVLLAMLRAFERRITGADDEPSAPVLRLVQGGAK